ncbi:MAG: HEAT repeat domain-containing protein [Kiritimatiellae bacterium]|nr:HEAT repeat domain-containing protein [Kiritimatiellia bacterium]MDD5521788.1 HEAT repeat domain-containing protein [Kiritimatiellia bacterium]
MTKKQYLIKIKKLLGTAFVALSSLGAAEPVIDVYVSTGDNHFLGSSLPIDSSASIEAAFDLLKNVNHARRVYWRGLEEACWVSTMHARPESCRTYSFWQWLQTLYAEVRPDELAVKAAHMRDMEIWGVGSLWDWGPLAETAGFGDVTGLESKLKLAHPEWAPVDKHGARRQGGPIELAYPEARKALVDLTVSETLKAGYDGICFLTYVENFSLRFQDEFGYSDPIVKDFKAQHKIDIRTEPFKRGASREDWLRLRGSYVTAFLRELKAELDGHKIKLGMVVNSNDPRQPQSWNVPELVLTAGSHHMDVDTWVRDGLVDELLIYGNNSPQSQYKTLDDLLFLARGTKTSVSVMTSDPFRTSWKPYQERGMPAVLTVSEDWHHLFRGFVPEQTVAALQSQDMYQRMRALQQCGNSPLSPALSPDESALVRCAASSNLIERRLALQALGKLKTADIKPLLAGLNDAENGVRCVAALALAERKDPVACQALLQAVERHGNHMLRECVLIALIRLTPLPVAELGDAALHSKSDNVREIAMRSLMLHTKPALLPVFREGLKDMARFPRFAAAEALGNIAGNSEVIKLLIDTLNHEDHAVANRAAVSLGRLAALKRPETGTLRPQMLAALIVAFKKHGDAKLPDSEWGWRSIGNAILDFGDEGAAVLRQIRDQREDMRLAELAWRVVDLTQRPNAFSIVSPEQNEEAMKRRPDN